MRLADLAQINPRVSIRPSADAQISFLGMADVDAESGTTSQGHDRPYGEVSKGYTPFESGDLLVAKITPCFENGKIAQASLTHRHGFGSTEFHVVRPNPDRLDARYALQLLRAPSVRLAGARRMTGSAGQRRVPENFLANLEIPVPPIQDQRRIANVLDRVDGVRANRRQALALLDDLTQSIFLDMFGAGQFETVTAGVLMPNMRNGLSPATTGEYPARVLTLSAVTQGPFDPTAVKNGLFAVEPPADKRVSCRDFLICRGNGNKALVGAGVYSAQDRADLVFPDTVIAGRVDPSRVQLPFLEVVWRQPRVRAQIEAAARTTNGTYKVNQQSLSIVKLPLPSLELQSKFVQRASAIASVRKRSIDAVDETNALFASLQQQAFAGLH